VSFPIVSMFFLSHLTSTAKRAQLPAGRCEHLLLRDIADIQLA
jgi:hypothetical protein